MVSGTRSSRKLKDEDHNSKNNTKDSSIHSPNNSGVRRSSRQTSLSRQMTPSPQSTRKSKRLEKGMPPLTPPVKRKSERLEKYNTPSPLRKSDRGKKILSSGSRQPAKKPTPSELKSKKGKSLIQVTMESEKAKLGMKRKKPNAKACKGLFKKQCIKKIVPDFDGELEGTDKLSCVSGDSTREKMEPNCSSSGNMDVPEEESSTCLARSQDGSINSECGEKHMHPKVVDATTSPSASQNCGLLGTCVLCSKHKRIRYDSPEQELCSCDHTGGEDLGRFSTCKDRNDHGDAVTLEFGDVCAVCNKDGELLSCVGKGCKRCYHKKLLFGVHSVSKGVESIWDAREVEVSNDKVSSSFTGEVSASAPEKRVVSSEEQRRLHSFLQGEIIRLCQILKLSDDVTHIVRNFLEYVMKNHHVNSDSPAIVQAFTISLCWISASISKQKIDKKKSLMLAKQLLNYQCTEEQASSVYSRMRSLKRMYLQSSDNTIRYEPTNVNKDGSHFSSFIQENAKMEIPEKTANEDKLASNDEICSMIKKIHKKNVKRMKKLIRKQQEEIQEFERICEEKKENLERDYRLESAVICSLHVQRSPRMEKLKVLDDNFAKKMEELKSLKNMQLKDLETKQLAIRDKERERADQLLSEAKAQSRSCNDEALGCDMTKVNSENSGDGNVCAGPPAPVERVSDQIPSAYPNVDFQMEVHKTVPNEITRREISNGSDKEYDEGNLNDTLVDNRDGPDEAANRELPSPVQSTVHSEPTLALQDCCDLLPQQVQDEIHLVSTELQDRDPLSEENQNTSQIEIPPLGLVTSVNLVPSNLEAPIADDIMTSVQSNNETPVTENSEQLQPVSANVSLSCDSSPAIEVDHQIHDQVRDFSQTAEQSISQCGESLELNGNNLVTVSASGIARGSNFELPNFAHNNVSTAELPSQAVMQLRVNMGHLDGVNYLPAHTTNPATSWNLSPTLFPDPLQTELESIRKQTEHLERNHGDTVPSLKSDCEKEIQEIIAQIRKKYEARLQGTESEFRLKRNELDKSRSNILMNKILAEAFRLKCLDPRPSGLPGVSSSFMQQLHQLSMPPPTRFHPGTPTLPLPLPLHQNSSPATTVQNIHQQQQSHSLRPTLVTNQSIPGSMRSNPVANQSSSGPSVQAVQNAADLFSSPFSRPNPTPPLISSITPTPNPTRLSGEIRSAAPHLQPFRPTSSTHSATSPSLVQSRPHSQPVVLQPPPPPPPPRPLQPPPPLPRMPSTNFVPQNRAEPQSVKEMDRRALMLENCDLSPLHEVCSNFRSLEISELKTLGNIQGNQTLSAGATNVVCLSDDE